ncbi:hypothetical protein [Flavobacterium sp. W21_SRS_FM6]
MQLSMINVGEDKDLEKAFKNGAKKPNNPSTAQLIIKNDGVTR